MNTRTLAERFTVKPAAMDCERYGHTIDQYLAMVDHILLRTCGLTSADLPDVVSVVDNWEDGVHPGDTAQEILDESGFDGEGE